MAYTSDIDEATFQLILEIIGKQKTGRPRRVNLHAIINALLYQTKNSVGWRDLPKDFPPWQTVHYYFRKWTNDGTLTKIMNVLTAQARKVLKDGEVQTASVDSQSVKGTPMNETSGVDGHKKIKGRKRHIMVDSLGLILAVLVTAANCADGPAGIKLFESYDRTRHPQLNRIFIDGTYKDNFAPWVEATCKIKCILNGKPPESEGFKLIKGRWVVERTFSWLSWYRRTNRDYERKEETSRSFVELSMISICIRRIKKMGSAVTP